MNDDGVIGGSVDVKDQPFSQCDLVELHAEVFIQIIGQILCK